MARIGRFNQRSLYSLGRRVGVALRRGWLNRFVRAKRVQLVELNGKPFKRITLADAWVAWRIARNLEVFRHFEIFPRLVAEVDNELLLEFVEGRALGSEADASLVERLARFFGTIYSVDRRRVKTEETDFSDEVQRDLAFLRDVAVLERDAWKDLSASASASVPPEVWVGYDYLDPLPKNFVVVPGGRLVAIDVEEIAADQLLGGGLAKILFRWSDVGRDDLLGALEAVAPLDLAPAMPFVELRFLAAWTKRAFLKGRAKLVDPKRFEPYRSPRGAGTAVASSMR